MARHATSPANKNCLDCTCNIPRKCRHKSRACAELAYNTILESASASGALSQQIGLLPKQATALCGLSLAVRFFDGRLADRFHKLGMENRFTHGKSQT